MRTFHSSSYSQCDSYQRVPILQGYPLPLVQAQTHIPQGPLPGSGEDGQYTAMSAPTTEGNAEFQEGDHIYDNPHNVNRPQFPVFPEGYIVMLSQGRPDPYNTLPAIHRSGYLESANEQYRKRRKSDTQSGGSNIHASTDPLVSHDSLPPESDDQMQSTTQDEATKVETPISEATTSKISDIINCFPLYLSMDTGKVYIDQRKTVAFHSHQLLDVSKAAPLLPPLPLIRPVSLLSS